MKKVLLIFSLTIIATLYINAQNIKFDILLLDFYKCDAVDFGLTNAKDIITVDQKHYRSNYNKPGFSLQYISEKKFSNAKLIESKEKTGYNQNNPFSTYSTFTYNKDKTLKSRYLHQLEEMYDEENVFKYDDKRRVVQIENILPNKHTSSFTYFDYTFYNLYDPSPMEQFTKVDYDDKKHDVLHFKFDSKGNIVSRNTDKESVYVEDTYWKYSYNDDNQIIEASIYKQKDFIVNNESLGLSLYKYNKKGLITEEKGTFSEYSTKTDKYSYVYEYVYDKYGNWIGKYKFTTIYGFQDYSSRNYKGKPEIWLRKLTYKNGETTGTTDIDALAVQSYLDQIESQNPLETKDVLIPIKGVSWSKNSETTVGFNKNGESHSDVVNYFSIIDDDAFVNDSVNNILYQLKGFKQKPILKEFYEANIFAQNNEAVWYKIDKDNIVLLVNGNGVRASSIEKALTNPNDRIFYINNVPKYVLHYEGVETFKMQKSISYGDYLKMHPEEDKNEVVRGVPLGAIWSKAEDGGFWFFYDGVNRSQNLDFTYFGDHCVIYDKIGAVTYLLKDLKTEVSNKFIKAIPYPGNKVWYKFKPNSFDVIINGQLDENTASGDYAKNGIDVVTINKANQKEYVLKNYTKTPLFVLNPMESYDNYTEQPSPDYILNGKIKHCNADGKCLASLYDEMYNLYVVGSTDDEFAQKMANYIVKVYNVSPRLAYTVLLTNRSSTNLLPLLMKKLPQDVRTSIKNSSNEMLNDYNDYINSNEVKEKVEKNGGTINTNSH